RPGGNTTPAGPSPHCRITGRCQRGAGLLQPGGANVCTAGVVGSAIHAAAVALVAHIRPSSGSDNSLYPGLCGRAIHPLLLPGRPALAKPVGGRPAVATARAQAVAPMG